eukprot:107600-Rhodomonas_salina.3
MGMRTLSHLPTDPILPTYAESGTHVARGTTRLGLQHRRRNGHGGTTIPRRRYHLTLSGLIAAYTHPTKSPVNIEVLTGTLSTSVTSGIAVSFNEVSQRSTVSFPAPAGSVGFATVTIQYTINLEASLIRLCLAMRGLDVNRVAAKPCCVDIDRVAVAIAMLVAPDTELAAAMSVCAGVGRVTR